MHVCSEVVRGAYSKEGVDRIVVLVALGMMLLFILSLPCLQTEVTIVTSLIELL